jgi:hypothetical protein
MKIEDWLSDSLWAWALHRLRVRRAQRDTRTASGWMTFHGAEKRLVHAHAGFAFVHQINPMQEALGVASGRADAGGRIVARERLCDVSRPADLGDRHVAVCARYDLHPSVR